MEISNDDNFGVRYANIVSIINTIEKYFKNNPENYKKTQNKLDIKSQLQINELLKCENSQLICLSEYLVFMTTISSRVNEYLDRIELLDDDKLLNKFCEITEKFQESDVSSVGGGGERGVSMGSGKYIIYNIYIYLYL